MRNLVVLLIVTCICNAFAYRTDVQKPPSILQQSSNRRNILPLYSEEPKFTNLLGEEIQEFRDGINTFQSKAFEQLYDKKVLWDKSSSSSEEEENNDKNQVINTEQETIPKNNSSLPSQNNVNQTASTSAAANVTVSTPPVKESPISKAGPMAEKSEAAKKDPSEVITELLLKTQKITEEIQKNNTITPEIIAKQQQQEQDEKILRAQTAVSKNFVDMMKELNKEAKENNLKEFQRKATTTSVEPAIYSKETQKEELKNVVGFLKVDQLLNKKDSQGDFTDVIQKAEKATEQQASKKKWFKKIFKFLDNDANIIESNEKTQESLPTPSAETVSAPAPASASAPAAAKQTVDESRITAKAEQSDRPATTKVSNQVTNEEGQAPKKSFFRKLFSFLESDPNIIVNTDPDPPRPEFPRFSSNSQAAAPAPVVKETTPPPPLPSKESVAIDRPVVIKSAPEPTPIEKSVPATLAASSALKDATNELKKDETTPPKKNVFGKLFSFLESDPNIIVNSEPDPPKPQLPRFTSSSSTSSSSPPAAAAVSSSGVKEPAKETKAPVIERPVATKVVPASPPPPVVKQEVTKPVEKKVVIPPPSEEKKAEKPEKEEESPKENFIGKFLSFLESDPNIVVNTEPDLPKPQIPRFTSPPPSPVTVTKEGTKESKPPVFDRPVVSTAVEKKVATPTKSEEKPKVEAAAEEKKNFFGKVFGFLQSDANAANNEQEPFKPQTTVAKETTGSKVPVFDRPVATKAVEKKVAPPVAKAKEQEEEEEVESDGEKKNFFNKVFGFLQSDSSVVEQEPSFKPETPKISPPVTPIKKEPVVNQKLPSFDRPFATKVVAVKPVENKVAPSALPGKQQKNEETAEEEPPKKNFFGKLFSFLDSDQTDGGETTATQPVVQSSSLPQVQPSNPRPFAQKKPVVSEVKAVSVVPKFELKKPETIPPKPTIPAPPAPVTETEKRGGFGLFNLFGGREEESQPETKPFTNTATATVTKPSSFSPRGDDNSSPVIKVGAKRSTLPASSSGVRSGSSSNVQLTTAKLIRPQVTPKPATLPPPAPIPVKTFTPPPAPPAKPAVTASTVIQTPKVPSPPEVKKKDAPVVVEEKKSGGGLFGWFSNQGNDDEEEEDKGKAIAKVETFSKPPSEPRPVVGKKREEPKLEVKQSSGGGLFGFGGSKSESSLPAVIVAKKPVEPVKPVVPPVVVKKPEPLKPAPFVVPGQKKPEPVKSAPVVVPVTKKAEPPKPVAPVTNSLPPIPAVVRSTPPPLSPPYKPSATITAPVKAVTVVKPPPPKVPAIPTKPVVPATKAALPPPSPPTPQKTGGLFGLFGSNSNDASFEKRPLVPARTTTNPSTTLTTAKSLPSPNTNNNAMNINFQRMITKLLNSDTNKINQFQKLTDNYRSGNIDARQFILSIEKLFVLSNLDTIVLPLINELPEKDFANKLKIVYEKYAKEKKSIAPPTAAAAATTTKDVSAKKESSGGGGGGGLFGLFGGKPVEAKEENKLKPSNPSTTIGTKLPVPASVKQSSSPVVKVGPSKTPPPPSATTTTGVVITTINGLKIPEKVPLAKRAIIGKQLQLVNENKVKVPEFFAFLVKEIGETAVKGISKEIGFILSKDKANEFERLVRFLKL